MCYSSVCWGVLRLIVATCSRLFLILNVKKLLNQWMGISMNIEDISKRPLTKFCQDILKQARMEYGREKKN